jgi:hypothetical protein
MGSFDVSSGTPPSASVNLPSFYSFLVGLVVAGVGYYSAAREGVYNFVVKVWKNHRDFIKSLVVFLIIVTVYTVILIRLIL